MALAATSGSLCCMRWRPAPLTSTNTNSTTWPTPIGTTTASAMARWSASIGPGRRDGRPGAGGKGVILGPTFDDEGREITPKRAFRYDTLIIAIGSVTNDFGTPGVKEFAIALETTEQAARFNRRLVNACLRAHAQPLPVRPGQLHVAIIGAGATGTELAAELHRTARAVIAYGLERVDPEKDIKITLIEAAPRILPALPERISAATTRLLLNLGVDVLTGARVNEVVADGVRLADGRLIPSEL